MKMNDHCLPCLINQTVKVAHMTKTDNKEELYRKVFQYLSTLDFEMTNPEIIGNVFQILKQHTGNNDPYKEVRKYYNNLVSEHADAIEKMILEAKDPFYQMIITAILGNIIDFSPMHHCVDDILSVFKKAYEKKLTIDHHSQLLKDIKKAKKILYIGDNCGEIGIDKLFLKQIRQLNEKAELYFGVRGAPVINDSIAEDAYDLGIDQYAHIISNGDSSLGTVLSRTNHFFQKIYGEADVIICKGSANFESLSEATGNRYFLMMVKCDVIAGYVQAPVGALLCLNKTA
ncbi:DUF89 family protein [[Clostridium] spiroforme]|nr:DUF89 family protein [Thomasclavelia spiroformis]MBM6879365.1 DUF89 family protein [Thomasclavelia spiroformis]